MYVNDLIRIFVWAGCAITQFWSGCGGDKSDEDADNTGDGQMRENCENRQLSDRMRMSPSVLGAGSLRYGISQTAKELGFIHKALAANSYISGKTIDSHYRQHLHTVSKTNMAAVADLASATNKTLLEKPSLSIDE